MYDGPVIDCDIHHTRVDDEELRDYLPRRWRDVIWWADGAKTLLSPPNPDFGSTAQRGDAFPANGGPPGSDYDLMCEQVLDPFGVEWALLAFGVGQEAGLTNVELSEAVVQAMNDWSVERWLDGKHDDRLCGACLVPLHLPEHGAAEIRRIGRHPKIATAFLAHNSLGKPLGHPVYHPVYEAAADLELPLYLHVGGAEYMTGVTAWQAGGLHAYSYDLYSTFHQSAALHLASLIVHGVLEKYPNLKIMVAEAGLAWFPWLAASLDAHYEQLRQGSAWVKKWPSEYLRERVALSTQPIETTPDQRHGFIAHMSSFEGIEDMLCFSSDYPHFDGDTPAYLEAILPESWHARVFHENARRFLRLPTGAGVRSADATSA